MISITELPAFKFYKEDTGRWYIDLPAWTGGKAALEMVEGADAMLYYVGEGANDVKLTLTEEPFDGANVLKLTQDLSQDIGGGIYFLDNYEGEAINQQMWLCEVTEWVFGKLPATIYFKKK